MDALLDATVRDTIGKNEARRTRRAVQVPAVVYGAGGTATSVAVSPKALLKILRSESGENTLISMSLGGVDTKVLVKDYQLDPITHQVLHADFLRVALDKPLEVTIPLSVKGECKGVKQQGGILELLRRDVVISCLPSDIPEHLDLDVTELMVGQGVRVRDVVTNAKWTPVTDREVMLVHVILPKGEEAAKAAAANEPEVIKKGKKDDAKK